ncbi:unnamed protein product, partial [Cylicocyclus nassatus]
MYLNNAGERIDILCSEVGVGWCTTLNFDKSHPRQVAMHQKRTVIFKIGNIFSVQMSMIFVQFCVGSAICGGNNLKVASMFMVHLLDP